MFLGLLLIFLVGGVKSDLHTSVDIDIDLHLGGQNLFTIDKTVGNVLGNFLKKKSHENFKLTRNFGSRNGLHFNVSAIGDSIIDEIDEFFEKLGLSDGNSSESHCKARLSGKSSLKELIYHEFFAFPTHFIPKAAKVFSSLHEFINKKNYKSRGYAVGQSVFDKFGEVKSAGALHFLGLLRESKDFVKGWAKHIFHKGSGKFSGKISEDSSEEGSGLVSGGLGKLKGKIEDRYKSNGKIGKVGKLLGGGGKFSEHSIHSGGIGKLVGKGGTSGKNKGSGSSSEESGEKSSGVSWKGPGKFGWEHKESRHSEHSKKSQHSDHSEHSGKFHHSGHTGDSENGKHSSISFDAEHSGHSDHSSHSEQSGQLSHSSHSKHSGHFGKSGSFNIPEAITKIFRHSPETARKIIKARLSRNIPHHPKAKDYHFSEYEALVCHGLSNSDDSFYNCLNEIKRINNKIHKKHRFNKKSSSQHEKLRAAAAKLILRVEILNNTCKINETTNNIDCFIFIDYTKPSANSTSQNSGKLSEISEKIQHKVGKITGNSEKSGDFKKKLSNISNFAKIPGDIVKNVGKIVKNPTDIKGNIGHLVDIPVSVLRNSGLLKVVHFIHDFFGGSFFNSAVSSGFDKFLLKSKSGGKFLNEVASLAYVYKEGLREKLKLEKQIGKEAVEKKRAISKALEEYKANVIKAGLGAIEDLREIAKSVEKGIVKALSQFLALDFSAHVKSMKCFDQLINAILSQWTGGKYPGSGGQHAGSGGHNGEQEQSGESSTASSESLEEDYEKNGDVEVLDVGKSAKNLLTSLDRLNTRSSIQPRKPSTITTLANTFLLATMFYECIAILAAAVYRSECNEHHLTTTTHSPNFTEMTTNNYYPHQDTWDYSNSHFSRQKSANLTQLKTESSKSSGGFEKLIGSSKITEKIGNLAGTTGIPSFFGKSQKS